MNALLTLAEVSIGTGLIGVGFGLVVLGAGLGIGSIGGNATSGIARQPEAAAKIQGAMILAAALIEGLAFAALIFGSFVLK